MDSSVLICIISSLCSLVGVIFTVRQGQRKADIEQKSNMNIIFERIDSLTKNVEKHNNFASRIPVLETRIEAIERQLNIK